MGKISDRILLAIAFTLGIVTIGVIKYRDNLVVVQQENTENQENWDEWATEPTTPTQPPVEQQAENLPTPKTYEEALSQSKVTGKKIFIFFTADWCHFCTKMKNNTFTNAEVKEALKSYIVLFVEDGKIVPTQAWKRSKPLPKDQDVNLMSKFGLAGSGIPCYVLTDHTQTALKKGVGYKTPTEFLDWLGVKEEKKDRKKLFPRFSDN